MSAESEFKEVVRNVVQELFEGIDFKIKGIANHVAEADANFMALVTLLEEKGIVDTDKLAKRQNEIMKKIKKEFEEFRVHNKADGVQ